MEKDAIQLTPIQEKAQKLSIIAMIVMIVGSVGLDQITKYVAESNLMVWDNPENLIPGALAIFIHHNEIVPQGQATASNKARKRSRPQPPVDPTQLSFDAMADEDDDEKEMSLDNNGDLGTGEDYDFATHVRMRMHWTTSPRS